MVKLEQSSDAKPRVPPGQLGYRIDSIGGKNFYARLCPLRDQAFFVKANMQVFLQEGIHGKKV